MRSTLSCLVFGAGLVTGCHEPFSNEDLLFLLATPQSLEIEVPPEEPPDTVGGEPARFARDAAKSAADTNKGVLSVLDIVSRIVAEPPSTREQNRRIRGPFPTTDRTEVVLVVDLVATATVAQFVSTGASRAERYFDYALSGRPIGGTDRDWLGLVFGSSHPRTDGPGAGRFFVSFENSRRLEPQAEERGAFFVGYDVSPDATVIEFLADADPLGTFEPNAAYQYIARDGGDTTYLFFEREDLVLTSDREEVLAIGARFLPSGRGRADVLVAEGDVLVPLFASECWNAQKERVFMLSTIPGPAFSPVGTVEDCGPDLLEAQFPE